MARSAAYVQMCLCSNCLRHFFAIYNCKKYCILHFFSVSVICYSLFCYAVTIRGELLHSVLCQLCTKAMLLACQCLHAIAVLSVLIEQ